MAHIGHFAAGRPITRSGLQFGVYEFFKGLWQRQRGLSPDALIGDIANLIMGLISGTITQSLTCPIKTVAIRIGSGVTGETSMGEAASNIYKESGVGGFLCVNPCYRGWSSRS
eukprot:COSAG02_NODE_4957_length_4782_cov_2.868674_5_plen_113_part_00